jgi:hypothetical protein
MVQVRVSVRDRRESFMHLYSLVYTFDILTKKIKTSIPIVIRWSKFCFLVTGLLSRSILKLDYLLLRLCISQPQ